MVLSKPMFKSGTQVAKITGQLLLNKISQEEIINEEFKDAKNALIIAKDGFDFLDIFLRQCHPEFSAVSIMAQTIPKFSDSGDLYKYCHQVQEYYARHKLKLVLFSEMDIS